MRREIPTPFKRSTLRLRGHTLLCLQGFRGEGYSPAFTDNLASIHRDLAENPDQHVEVVDSPDAVCGACPHKAPSGCAVDGEGAEEGMTRQDRHVLERLGLTVGHRLRWRDVLARIRRSLSGDDLPGICGACRWLPLGYCREGLERLRSQDSEPATLLSPDRPPSGRRTPS